VDDTVAWLRERPYYEDQIRAGEDVVLATETASGKSLAYTVPAFERALDDRATTLYLAPQVALVDDQTATLSALAAELGYASGVEVAAYTGRPTIFVYDGYPGGVALARTGYDDIEGLLQTTLSRVLENLQEQELVTRRLEDRPIATYSPSRPWLPRSAHQSSHTYRASRRCCSTSTWRSGRSGSGSTSSSSSCSGRRLPPHPTRLPAQSTTDSSRRRSPSRNPLASASSARESASPIC
jgi:hypothetical protein